MIIKDNLASGVRGYGFIYKGYDCNKAGEKTTYLSRMSGNSAQSTMVGFTPYMNAKCLGFSDFTAIRCDIGIASFFE